MGGLCESSPVPSPENLPDRKRTRGLSLYWVSFFVGITVLLSVLAAGRMAERKRMEEKYATTTHMIANKMAADFEHHLSQLAEDARLLAELHWQTGQDPQYPKTVRERVLRDGVRALSSAVHFCRGVGFSQDGKEFEVALDPSEDAALGPWLKEEARKIASQGRASPRLLGPMQAPGDRPFFVQVQDLSFGMVVACNTIARPILVSCWWIPPRPCGQGAVRSRPASPSHATSGAMTKVCACSWRIETTWRCTTTFQIDLGSYSRSRPMRAWRCIGTRWKPGMRPWRSAC
jgi:hypothetical protein